MLSKRLFIFPLMFMLSAACGLFSSYPMSAELPTPTLVDLDSVRTVAAATAFIELTRIAAVTATPTAAAAVTNPMPTLEPAKIQGLLSSSLSVETLDAFDRHALRRVSGWDYGFNGFEWMDTGHLLLRPVVGAMFSENRGRWYLTYPTVLNLDSKQAWLPALGDAALWDGFRRQRLPQWSAQLGKLISYAKLDDQDALIFYEPDGKISKVYNGELLGISPSRTKILIAGDTWIDLLTGKTVDFDWYQERRDSSLDILYPGPIWSPDETRVYTCCYVYGDAQTGESAVMPFSDFTIDGEKQAEGVGEPLYNFFGTWVLDDKYMLSQWGGIWDGSPGFVPLFDPSAKTYRNLSKLAGIPFGSNDTGDWRCHFTYAAPGGRYVWVGSGCFDADYLVDLATFKSTAYPAYSISDIDWSTDGKFALVRGDSYSNNQSFVQILSVATKELKPLLNIEYCMHWHPIDDVLACGSKDARTLSLVDARTVSVQKEVALPFKLQELIWSPDGKQIALLARDGSIWLANYPGLDGLQQVTRAMSELTHQTYTDQMVESLMKNISWSPDGAFLAFIGNRDIYIVDTKTGNP